MGIEGDLLWALKRHLFKVSCGFPAITRRRLILIVRKYEDDVGTVRGVCDTTLS